jgi:hypothetical protein
VLLGDKILSLVCSAHSFRQSRSAGEEPVIDVPPWPVQLLLIELGLYYLDQALLKLCWLGCVLFQLSRDQRPMLGADRGWLFCHPTCRLMRTRPTTPGFGGSSQAWRSSRFFSPGIGVVSIPRTAQALGQSLKFMYRLCRRGSACSSCYCFAEAFG